MATETTTKMTCSMKLDNGTTASGAQKYVSVSLGTLDKDAWNATKALNIVAALETCLDKSIEQVVHVLTNAVTE